MTTRIGWAAVLLVAGAAAASAQAPTDRILKPDNTEIKCRITKCTYQAVVYTEKGNTVTLKGTEVSDIVFADEPMAFASAKNAVAERKIDKAATRFEEALKEIETKKLRDWNKAPLFIHWSMFLAERGDSAGALAMLKRLRSECGDTWWRPDSYRKGLEIARAAGAEAQKSILEEMQAEPEPLASEARMELAQIALKQGDPDEALNIFAAVASSTTSPYAEAAKVGTFRALKSLKKNADLDAYCAKLMADPSTSPALLQAAGAWTAGGLLEKAGKDRAKIRSAILAAAKAIAMGPPYGKEDAEDYVAALRVAAKGYATLATEAKGDVKKEYQERASGYLMEIVRAYKGTPWAESAQLELQSMGVSQN